MGAHAAANVMDGAAPNPERTFDRLYQEYRPCVHRYLSRLVGPLDAEDLTQLVFVRVSQALPDFRGESSLATWIYCIARNAAADWQRSGSRTAALHDALAAEVVAGGTERNDTAAPADQTLIRRDVQRCVRGVIGRLPHAYRDVLALRELSGLSTTAIANTLGLSADAVKVRLHRARARLRDVLTAGCTLSHDSDGVSCESKHGVACCGL